MYVALDKKKSEFFFNSVSIVTRGDPYPAQQENKRKYI